jgi:hypothetical protein
MEWMKWRRNRLAAKLVATQERLEVLSLKQYDSLDDLPFVNNPIHFTLTSTKYTILLIF